MKIVAALAGLLALLLLGSLARTGYLLWVRPLDAPTASMVAVAESLAREGVSGKLEPVRHTFSHSEVLAVASYVIDDYPLPIGVSEYASEEAARKNESAVGHPDYLQPLRMGAVIVSFNAWGDDTSEMALRVRKALGTPRGA